MIKFLLLLCFIPTLFFAEDIKKIDKKINYNKNMLKLKEDEKNKTNQKVEQLVKAIKSEEDVLDQLEQKLKTVSNTILLNRLKLSHSKKHIEKLKEKTLDLQNSISQTEEKLANTIIEKYTLSISKNMLEREDITDIVNEEKFKLLSTNTKDNILKSNLQYFKLSNDQARNNKKKKELEEYIASQEKEKEKFLELKKEQEDSVDNLKKKHTAYQKELKSIIDKQYNLNKLLGKLNILKENEKEKKRQKRLAEKRKKERLAKLKAQQEKRKKAKSKTSSKSSTSKKTQKSKDIKMISKNNLQDEIDLKVRNLGDSSKGIKISKYKGIKLSAPLKKYTITKKFGKYYDPIYKIKLFNESISIKSKVPNAKVYASLKGKVVYAKKDAGALGNVVILKHKSNIHTIYSQLSQIPKTIKVGKWVPKGYVVGRVDDTLIFQVTKDNRYLDPKELF